VSVPVPVFVPVPPPPATTPQAPGEYTAHAGLQTSLHDGYSLKPLPPPGPFPREPQPAISSPNAAMDATIKMKFAGDVVREGELEIGELEIAAIVAS
jgi:hypothetical protein